MNEIESTNHYARFVLGSGPYEDIVQRVYAVRASRLAFAFGNEELIIKALTSALGEPVGIVLLVHANVLRVTLSARSDLPLMLPMELHDHNLRVAPPDHVLRIAV